MSQTTDSPCLALKVQESVLDPATKTRTGWRPLIANSTAGKVLRKLLITRYSTSFTARSIAMDSITRYPPYAASVQGRLVERISDVDIELSIKPH